MTQKELAGRIWPAGRTLPTPDYQMVSSNDKRKIIRFSENEQIFNTSIATYQNSLNNANFKHTLKYTENKKTETKKKTN